jgi:hypothetical protein
VTVGGALALQIKIAREYDAATWWWVPVVVAALGGAWILASTLVSRLRRAAVVGFGAVALALFVIPGIWSGLTAAGSSPNQSLPAAYAGTSSRGPDNQGGLQINQQLLSFLQANTQDMKYLMAVPSSMQGADYVIATGRPVLYIGGFMGQDPVVNADGLAQLVADGDLRYIYWDARGGGFNNSSDVSRWVTTACTQVQGYQTNTQNSGAPDGTQGSAVRSAGAGAMQVELYDCSSAGG